MSDQFNVVIVGGVAAGPKTAAVLARRLPDVKITLFQKEQLISYGTCGLPYFASGDINSFDDLTRTGYGVIRDIDFFKQTKNIDVITGAEVIKINRESRTVLVKRLTGGETFERHYDKLVLATGAVTMEPPFSVPQSERISTFTRPDDAINFRKLAETGQVGKAVIIGGGFIGCELAEATGGLWGIETVLVEKEPQVLPYILDSEMSAIVERELKRQDVQLLTGAEVTKVTLDSDDNPLVSIKGHDDIGCDYLFLALGVRPNVKLAADCGLAIGKTGGIDVNDHLCTSDPDIYAGGDCVESLNLITGEKVFLPMGSLANRHGRVIAENLSGGNSRFPGVVGAFMVKVYDLNVGAVGLSEQAAGKVGRQFKSLWASFPDKPDYYPEVATFSLKLIYNEPDNRLLGLQAVGKGDVCRRIDVFSAILRQRGTIQDLLDFEQGYAPPYSEALDPLYHLAAMAQAQQRGFNFIAPVFDTDDSAEDTIYLDIREPDEIKLRPTPPGLAVLVIPLNDLRGRIAELDRGKTVKIICRRGPRSYQAAVILQQTGFENVLIISGGTQASLS